MGYDTYCDVNPADIAWMLARSLFQESEERVVVHSLDVDIGLGVVHHLYTAVLVDVAVELVHPSLSGIHTRF